MNRTVKTLLFICLLINCIILIHNAELRAQEKSQNEVKLIAVAAIRDSLNSNICPQFGRAPKFIIYNLETETFTVFENKSALSSSGAGRGTSENLISKGVEVVIARNCGGKALDALKSAKIKVFSNVTGTVKDAIEAFKKGKLKETK